MGKKKFKCVGLIIKDRSLAAVEVENNKNGPSITNYSKILLEEGIVANGCIILNKESFQEAVKKLLSNGVGGPIKTDEILISLPEERVFSHEIEIPREKVNDADFIKVAARDFIPIELNKAVFDYNVIGENTEAKTLNVNFIATQNSIAESIMKALKEIRLNVVRLNVDINCFVRSFHNSLNQGEGDFLVVNLNIEQDFFAINSEKDGITKLICKADKKEMIDKIKALHNLSTTSEVEELLIKFRKGEGLTEEQRTELKVSFREYLERLKTKIRQLVSAAEAKSEVEIHNIYLTGIFSGLPGVEESVAELLPDIPIKKGVTYTEVPVEIEEDALQGIGLCLGNTLEKDKGCYNLIPQNKKDELNLARVSPKIKILSMVLSLLLIVFSIQIGLKAARNYLDYKITSQEVSIYNEQALNPYVTQVARIKQQKKQNESQILSLLNDALPVSILMSDLNVYNTNGLTMVNITFNDNPALNTSDISVRAKTSNRDETEKFIASLEESPLYSEVDSPLSNLVGKGERFISVGLTVDKEVIIESYRAQFEAAQESAKTPSNPQEVTPEENNA